VSRRGLRKRRLLTLIASVVIAGVLVVLGAIWLAVLVLLIAVWRASRYQGVPVMVYHAVAPNPGWLPWADNTAIRPAVFAAHMAHLAKSGWQVIASRDLIAAQAGAPLPKRAVVLHFDDAYLDFWTRQRALRRPKIAMRVSPRT